MKKLLLFILFGLFVQTGFSQVYVDKKNINDLDIKYVRIICIQNSLFSSNSKIYIDYGAPAKHLKKYKVTDTNGKEIEFNSTIDALNYMYKHGWENIEYTQYESGMKTVVIYLLERRD